MSARECRVRALRLSTLWVAGMLWACASSPERALLGVWKSDAPRTLESMRALDGIPADRRAALERDYYGHLTVEYRADVVRGRMDDGRYDSGYQPYKVVEATPEYVVTDEWNEILHEFRRSTTYFDGECIYGWAAEYRYREYFCRVAPLK